MEFLRSNIINNGLLVYFDVGIKTSYPGSGTSVVDLASVNDGTIVGSGWSYDTERSGCLSFSGTNAYINLGDKDSFTFSTGYTFEFWCKLTTLTTNPLIDKYAPGGYELTAGFFSSSLYSWMYDQSLLGYRGRVSSSYSLSANTWANLVFVYRGGTISDSTELYINNARPVESNFQNGSFTQIRNTTTALSIGRANDGVGPSFLNGKLAIFRVYSRALSIAEINQNFQVTRKRFGV